MLRIVVAAAAAMIVALVLSGSAATAASGASTPAAKADPVLLAIARALKSGDITLVKAIEFNRTWAISDRARRAARSSSRRANVVATRDYATSLARSGGLVPSRIEPVLLSVKATSYVMMNASTYPSHEAEMTIPGERVVFTYYSGRGVQFQPFESFKVGMRLLNQAEPDLAEARLLADRMRELSVAQGGTTTWEYYFPFGGPSKPWTSAISQALAVEFFSRVGDSVPAPDGAGYGQVADSVMRSFQKSPSAGGVAVTEGKGRFYLLYPFNPRQRILNGHLQALLNLNRYAESSGSPLARQLVASGMTSALELLPRFDTGAWSNYQLGQEADLGYHEFQTTQLVKLGRETKDPKLVEYGERFRTYLKTPPTITIPATSWLSILPVLDGYRDSVVIRYSTDKRAKLTMVLRDADGDEVRRFSASGGRGSGTLTWDGRDARGRTVLEGSYEATITATDLAGNRSTGELSSPLRVEVDRTPPILSQVTVRPAGAKTIVIIRAGDAGSGYIDAEIFLRGAKLGSKRGPRVGTTVLRIDKPIAVVQRGALVLRDSSGNTTIEQLTP